MLSKEDLEAIRKHAEILIHEGWLTGKTSSDTIGADLSALLSELEQVRHERDAAVADLSEAVQLLRNDYWHRVCDSCKYANDNPRREDCIQGSRWQWRGLERDEVVE